VFRPQADPYQPQHHRHLDQDAATVANAAPDDRPNSIVAMAMATSRYRPV